MKGYLWWLTYPDEGLSSVTDTPKWRVIFSDWHTQMKGYLRWLSNPNEGSSSVTGVSKWLSRRLFSVLLFHFAGLSNHCYTFINVDQSWYSVMISIYSLALFPRCSLRIVMLGKKAHCTRFQYMYLKAATASNHKCPLISPQLYSEEAYRHIEGVGFTSG